MDRRMNKEQVKAWREAYLAHNRQVIEERRAATIEERWQAIGIVDGLLNPFGRTPRERPGTQAARQRWLHLKEAHCGRG